MIAGFLGWYTTKLQIKGSSNTTSADKSFPSAVFQKQYEDSIACFTRLPAVLHHILRCLNYILHFILSSSAQHRILDSTSKPRYLTSGPTGPKHPWALQPLHTAGTNRYNRPLIRMEEFQLISHCSKSV